MKLIKKMVGFILITIFCIPTIILLSIVCLLCNLLNMAVEWCDSNTQWGSTEDLNKQEDTGSVYDDFE